MMDSEDWVWYGREKEWDGRKKTIHFVALFIFPQGIHSPKSFTQSRSNMPCRETQVTLSASFHLGEYSLLLLVLLTLLPLSYISDGFELTFVPLCL